MIAARSAFTPSRHPTEQEFIIAVSADEPALSDAPRVAHVSANLEGDTGATRMAIQDLHLTQGGLQRWGLCHRRGQPAIQLP